MVPRLLVMAALAAALLLPTFDEARATTRLDPSHTAVFCSENFYYCAMSTVTPAYTRVLSQTNDVVWARAEFVRKGFLSIDGQVMISCYAGLSLVPEDASLDLVVARVLHASGKVEEVTLRALYTSMSQLPRSDSHRVWGYCTGIEDGKLVLQRADGSRWESAPL